MCSLKGHWRCMSLMLFAVLVSIVSLGGCSTKTSDRDLVFLNPHDAIDAIRTQRRVMGLGGERSGVWLDPRTDEEYKQGHIPGAIHMPMQQVRQDHGILRDYSVIVVYGNDYNSPRATAVSKTLMELGYRDVRTLRGGLKAWQEAGFSLQQSE
jgi:phage shock protein E